MSTLVLSPVDFISKIDQFCQTTPDLKINEPPEPEPEFESGNHGLTALKQWITIYGSKKLEHAPDWHPKYFICNLLKQGYKLQYDGNPQSWEFFSLVNEHHCAKFGINGAIIYYDYAGNGFGRSSDAIFLAKDGFTVEIRSDNYYVTHTNGNGLVVYIVNNYNTQPELGRAYQNIDKEKLRTVLNFFGLPFFDYDFSNFPKINDVEVCAYDKRCKDQSRTFIVYNDPSDPKCCNYAVKKYKDTYYYVWYQSTPATPTMTISNKKAGFLIHFDRNSLIFNQFEPSVKIQLRLRIRPQRDLIEIDINGDLDAVNLEIKNTLIEFVNYQQLSGFIDTQTLILYKFCYLLASGSTVSLTAPDRKSLTELSRYGESYYSKKVDQIEIAAYYNGYLNSKVVINTRKAGDPTVRNSRVQHINDKKIDLKMDIFHNGTHQILLATDRYVTSKKELIGWKGCKTAKGEPAVVKLIIDKNALIDTGDCLKYRTNKCKVEAIYQLVLPAADDCPGKSAVFMDKEGNLKSSDCKADEIIASIDYDRMVPITEAFSCLFTSPVFKYRVGQTIKISDFVARDMNCGRGIHFFIDPNYIVNYCFSDRVPATTPDDVCWRSIDDNAPMIIGARTEDDSLTELENLKEKANEMPVSEYELPVSVRENNQVSLTGHFAENEARLPAARDSVRPENERLRTVIQRNSRRISHSRSHSDEGDLMSEIRPLIAANKRSERSCKSWFSRLFGGTNIAAVHPEPKKER